MRSGSTTGCQAREWGDDCLGGGGGRFEDGAGHLLGIWRSAESGLMWACDGNFN